MVKKKLFTIVWDRWALDHLKEILAYLESQSKNAPKIVKKALFDRVEIIKVNPYVFESDKLKDPEDDQFHAFVIFSYRVTYQINEDNKEVRIIRIRHTSREPLDY
jgi:plasmid stabilization system protein ParE